MRQALLLLLVLASAASAQVAVSPGARVRMIPADKYDVRRAGKVISASADSAVVQFEPVPEWELRSDRLEVPLSKLEVLTATRRYKARGAVIGAVALGVTGIVIAEAVDETCWESPSGTRSCSQDGSVAPILGIGGALAGAWLGGMVGAIVHFNTWTPAAAPPRTSLVPMLGPSSAGLAIRFAIH